MKYKKPGDMFNAFRSKMMKKESKRHEMKESKAHERGESKSFEIREEKGLVKDKKRKTLKLNPKSKGHAPKGAHGRAAVRALGRTKTTGNFKKIEKARGKGAAIMAYQNALRAHKGK